MPTILALLLVASAGAHAQSVTAPMRTADVSCGARPSGDARPRIGLALGGGGARGIAHISVLRKLEQMRVPIDCIAGTSMGALVGAMYASGMSVDEIEKTVLALDWGQMFDDSLARRERSYRRKTDDQLSVAAPGIGLGKGGVKIAAGLLAGERILLLFEKMIEPVSTVEDFDRLPIPFCAVAADINTGEYVVLHSGDLALAMRASMSLPGVFPPVIIGDHVLVDGGVARNLPIDVVREMGADIVIAVDVGTPLGTMTPESGIFAISSQVTGLLTVRNTRQQLDTLTEHDVLISPPLGRDVATADFAKARQALDIGKEGAAAATGRLASLSLSEEAYARSVAGRGGSRQTAPPIVQFVRLDNRSRYRDDVLLARIDVPLDEPLDSTRLEAALYNVFGLSAFSQSSYEVIEEGGKIGVILHVHEKIQGPNYVEVGMRMSGDFAGRYDFGLRLGVLQTPINDSGGEARYLVQLGDQSGLLAEYYQPFGTLGRYFFASRAQYENLDIPVYNSPGHQVAEYDIRQIGIGLGFGREYGNYGALTWGVQRFTGGADVQVGDSTLPKIDAETGETYVEGTLDRLDSVAFPRDGYLARVRYTYSLESLGANTEFEHCDFDTIGARSFGKHSIQLGMRYHVTTSGTSPIQSLYRLGGFTRLVGFQRNELAGQDYAILLGGYSYQIHRVFNQNAIVGALLEYGNVWQRRSDMAFGDGVLNGSVYIGLDSWIGPILFGIGGREGSNYNLFLELGHRF